MISSQQPQLRLASIIKRLVDDDGRAWKPTDWILGAGIIGLAVASVCFFSLCYIATNRDSEFFSRLAALPTQLDLDPVVTGTVSELDGAMPAPAIVRVPEPKPSDYQIVMVFGDEAFLATPNELMRVKVGSVLPGLGPVLAIRSDATGSTVQTKMTTLTTLANP